LADIAKRGHHTDDCAHESEQRRNADYDFQHDQSALEPNHLVTSACLHRVHIIGFGPMEMLYGASSNRLIGLLCCWQTRLSIGHVLGCLGMTERLLDFVRHNPAPPQRQMRAQ